MIAYYIYYHEILLFKISRPYIKTFPFQSTLRKYLVRITRNNEALFLKMAQESVHKVKQTRVILSTVNSNAVAVCLGFSTNMINDFGYKKRCCIL